MSKQTTRSSWMESTVTTTLRQLISGFKLNRPNSEETLQMKKSKILSTPSSEANWGTKRELSKQRIDQLVDKQQRRNLARKEVVIGMTGKTLNTLRNSERHWLSFHRNRSRSRCHMVPRKRRRRARRRRRELTQVQTLLIWTMNKAITLIKRVG